MKLSQWLDGNPELPGVYARRLRDSRHTGFFARWTGDRWLIGQWSAQAAAQIDDSENSKSPNSLFQYRGLAERPHAPDDMPCPYESEIMIGTNFNFVEAA